MTIQELRDLAKYAASRTAPANYTVNSVDAAVAEGFASFCGSINNFNRNKFDIYDIIIENADTIVPQKVMEQMGAFAEIRNVANGDKPLFKKGGLGRARAKKFLTQVGLSGVYETFRLDNETFTISTKAIGGAVSVDFERLIAGAESLSEFMDVLTESQVDGIYAEVQGALMAAVNSTAMPARNKCSGSYSADNLQEIVNTVKAYGSGAVIFASPEFVAAMGPDAIVPAIQGVAQGIYSPADIEAIHNTGSVKIFRGTPIVELRQSFLDEKNEKVMINPRFAYVLPSGGEKVVKIIMEGQTQIWDATNRDQSIEINTYRKIGVGILAFNNWGVYENTGIPANDWYNDDILGIDVNTTPGL